MRTGRFITFLSIAAVLSLVISLLFTATAVADDDAPTPTPEPGGEEILSTESEMDSISTPESDAETAISENESAPESEDFPSDTSSEDDINSQEFGDIEGEPQEITDLPSVYENVSEETGVAVLMDGELEPLATQDAAQAVIEGDPIWCPVNEDPNPGLNNCTNSFATLSLLVMHLETMDPDEPGVIWILAGNDLSAPATIEIDGSNLSNMRNHALTLQGGWDGSVVDGSVLGNISNTTSIFSKPLLILDWNAAVTLNQITIENSASTGLYVDIDGKIILEEVVAVSNTGNGVELHTPEDVTLLGENRFEDNHLTGLYIVSGGDVSAEDILADGNLAGDGVYIDASGSVDILDISAADNGGTGVSLTGNGVYINSSGSFLKNQQTGLYIDSSGDVYLQDVIAEENGNSGILVTATSVIDLLDIVSTDNQGYGGYFYTAADIYVSGHNIFNDNLASGFYAESTAGEIFAENISADRNGYIGTELFSFGDTYLDFVDFAENDGSGIYIEAGGNLFVEEITSVNNGLGGFWAGGAEIFTDNDFFLYGSNQFNANRNFGLLVSAGGDVFVENIIASDNGTGGVTYAPGAEFSLDGAFVLSGSNVFENNKGDGLYVDSDGGIEIYNILSTGNDNSGLLLISGGDAEVECGVVTGNSVPQIDASLSGALSLIGVDFGGNPDVNVGIDPSRLSLISNGCFTYPSFPDSDPEDDGGGILYPSGISYDVPDPLILRYVTLDDGELADLSCDPYDATVLFLRNGDGVIVPCPITGSVQLHHLNNVPSLASPAGNVEVLSGIEVLVNGGDLISSEMEQPNTVLFVNPTALENGGYETSYWNGTEWVYVTNQLMPYLTVFFVLPDDLTDQELAILFWDGIQWVELYAGANIGNGRIVREMGFSKDGLRFQAGVNFIGSFVLVRK